jgi:methionine synthase II (cobalamin-independent)
MGFKPAYRATAVGSFPHTDAGAACDLILGTIPEIPTWPQLPQADFREGMEIQYSEGLPCAVIDQAARRLYFDSSGDTSNALATFYERYLAGDTDYFAISPAFSRGIYEMERRLRQAMPVRPAYFKHQVTGPVTMGLSRTDENKRAIYYNDVFRDVIVKGMEMKARWLIRRFAFLGCPQICFIDEPILSAFGSSTYVSVERSDVVKCLGDVVEAVHGEGALAGTHCCGNTEWSILVDAGVDVMSFDAYQYGETLAYYPREIAAFLERGGVLAWGVVPSTEAISRETPESTIELLQKHMQRLAHKGIADDILKERCLLTPSCGTGTLSCAGAEKVMATLAEVSRILRQEVSGSTSQGTS